MVRVSVVVPKVEKPLYWDMIRMVRMVMERVMMRSSRPNIAVSSLLFLRIIITPKIYFTLLSYISASSISASEPSVSAIELPSSYP